MRTAEMKSNKEWSLQLWREFMQLRVAAGVLVTWCIAASLQPRLLASLTKFRVRYAEVLALPAVLSNVAGKIYQL